MRLSPFTLGLFVSMAALGTSCGDDAGPPDARRIDSEPEGGTVSLTWAIADPDGTAVSCSAVGATSLALSLVPTNQPFGVTDVLSCGALEGTSRPLAPGTYDITAELGGVTAPEVFFNNVVVESGADTPIGSAAFEVIVEGGFEFRTAAGTGGNCVAIASGGAGLTSVSIALADAASVCVPVTFDIAASNAGGGGVAGTYTTSCGTPAAFPSCIAEDQTISVAPTLPSGTYRMTITGFVGAEACWSRNPQFNVPAGGDVTKLLPQNLNLDTANAACAN
jgi:hypothetical protein